MPRLPELELIPDYVPRDCHEAYMMDLIQLLTIEFSTYGFQGILWFQTRNIWLLEEKDYESVATLHRDHHIFLERFNKSIPVAHDALLRKYKNGL